MEKEAFAELINKKRIDSKQKSRSGLHIYSWYYFTGTVEGRYIELKGYKTWLQIFNIDGKRCDGCMDISVKEFKASLISPFINSK